MKLPSGAELIITLSPFVVSRDLYQAVLSEVRTLTLDPNAEVDVNLKKDLFCLLLSSKKIEACLWKCMERVTYNGLKITEDTFESVTARDDYFTVCSEVAKENVLPFVKSLSAEFSPILEMLKSSPA